MEEEIRKAEVACEKYHFQYHTTVNGIFIRTLSLAGWFIEMDGNKPRLFHENYRYVYKYGNKVMERYHEHTNMQETTAEGFVEYIYAHDKNMLKTNRVKGKGQNCKYEQKIQAPKGSKDQKKSGKTRKQI